jgi:hypothetical protein
LLIAGGGRTSSVLAQDQTVVGTHFSGRSLETEEAWKQIVVKKLELSVTKVLRKGW